MRCHVEPHGFLGLILIMGLILCLPSHKVNSLQEEFESKLQEALDVPEPAKVCYMFDKKNMVTCHNVDWQEGFPRVSLPSFPEQAKFLHLQITDLKNLTHDPVTISIEQETKKTVVVGNNGEVVVEDAEEEIGFRGPYVEFQYPEYGDIFAQRDGTEDLAIVAHFQVRGLPIGARIADYALLFSVAGQGEMVLPLPNDRVTFGGLEPGTHAVSAAVHPAAALAADAQGRPYVRGGPLPGPGPGPPPPPLPGSAHLLFDTLPPPARVTARGGGDDDAAPQYRHAPAARERAREAAAWAALPALPRAPGAVRLVFVGGTGAFDGQKRLWLQQLGRLVDRGGRFDAAYLSMTGEDPAATASGPLQSALRRLGVPLIVAPLPGVPLEEVAGLLNRDQPGAEDDLTQLVAFALEALETAGRNVSQVSPAWARTLWEHCVAVWEATAPDVVVYGNARDPTDHLLTVSAKLAGVRALVMELPNLYPPAPVLADAVVAPSHYAARHPSVAAAVPAGVPRVVITPGVDTAAFSRAAALAAGGGAVCPHPGCGPPRPSAGPGAWGPGALGGGRCSSSCVTIGFMARLSREKSVGLFIDTAARVAAAWPFARFSVVGAGPLRPYLERLARRRGIGELVHFAGGVYGPGGGEGEGELLPRHLAGWDLAVNPSLRAWSETFCIANIEIMSMEIPIISFGVGGIGEYLVHNTQEQNRQTNTAANATILPGGIVVDDISSKGLADATISLIQNSSERLRYGQAARIAIKTHFELHAQMEKYQKLYSALVDEQELMQSVAITNTSPP